MEGGGEGHAVRLRTREHDEAHRQEARRHDEIEHGAGGAWRSEVPAPARRLRPIAQATASAAANSRPTIKEAIS